jgi:protease IV
MRELLAHIQFRGTIRERAVEPYLQLLKAVGLRRRFRGVLLDISSGGGASVPSTDLYLAVKRLDAIKPVYASIGGIGASGAYLAALGARRVFAYPDSEVGSIGVIFPHVAVERLLDKLGIEVELLHQGRHKDAYQGLRPLTEEERSKLLAVAGDSYEAFIQTVARERHRPLEEVRALATGEFWSGRKALELGLVDALGDRESALQELARLTGVPVRKAVRVVPPRPFLERLFSSGALGVGPALSEGVRESLEDALVDLSVRGRL